MVYTFASSSATLAQLAISVTNGTLYTRYYSSGTWGNWIEYVKKDETPLLYGKGTYTDVTLVGVVGFMTTSGTQAELFAPLLVTRDLTSSSLTINAITASIRHVGGGYLGGQNNANVLSYIDNVTLYRQQGGVRIILINSNGWGITNNTPLSGSIKISFTLS